MPFSESTKLKVKRKANFTCCWCQDRRNKVEIHHIDPESGGGPDTEGNAAPLCGSCHDLLGMNPDLRKEIRQRRDHWYEICSRQFETIHNWPVSLDVPVLDFCKELPQEFRDRKGIQFADEEPSGKGKPPMLYLSVYYKPPIYHPSRPDVREKWLSVSADMRFAFHLAVEVCAWNDQDVSNMIKFLRGQRSHCDLAGKEGPHGINYFAMFNRGGENRLVVGIIAPTKASIFIRARFSERAVKAFTGYLEEVGFADLDW
jgi:hypothetical protein